MEGTPQSSSVLPLDSLERKVKLSRAEAEIKDNKRLVRIDC